MLPKIRVDFNLFFVKNPFQDIADNLDELNGNFTDSLDTIKNMIDFFKAVGNFFREFTYWISHPVEVLNAFQPWIIIFLMILICLKIIGFKPDKWIALFFILMIISIVF